MKGEIMSAEVEGIFRKAGALLEGHFLLTSGLHSPAYWEKFRLLEHPDLTVKLCRLISRHFKDSGVQAVAGPTVGGIIIAFEVARQLGVRSLYAEREDTALPGKGTARVFRRGFTLAAGERVLVVDDVLTTGGSLREVIDAVTRLGGEVIGVAVLVDRSGKEPDLGVPLFSCHLASLATYAPEKCPLCASGVPLVKPGSGVPPRGN